MTIIHHLDTSRSERIVWLMEELALPYRLDEFAPGCIPPSVPTP